MVTMATIGYSALFSYLLYIWGYLRTKFKVSSIRLSRDVDPPQLFRALKTPSIYRVKGDPPCQTT